MSEYLIFTWGDVWQVVGAGFLMGVGLTATLLGLIWDYCEKPKGTRVA